MSMLGIPRCENTGSTQLNVIYSGIIRIHKAMSIVRGMHRINIWSNENNKGYAPHCTYGEMWIVRGMHHIAHMGQ